MVLAGSATIIGGTINGVDQATVSTVGSRAFSALNSAGALTTKVLPLTPVSPSSAGLYLGSDYLGYFGGTNWRSYIDASGNFVFRAAPSASVSVGALIWTSSTGILQGGSYAAAAGPAYGAFTEQWSTDAATGEIVAGAGVVKMGVGGLRFTADYSYGNNRAIRWIAGANDLARIWTLQQSSTRGDLHIETYGSGDIEIGSDSGGSLLISPSLDEMIVGMRLKAPDGISSSVNMTSQRASSSDDYGALVCPVERAAALTQWTVILYVGTTNNGSNYWTFTLKRLDTEATIDSFNTSGYSASTWTRVSRSLGVDITTGMAGLYVNITKTGSPGSVQSAHRLYLK